MLIRPYAPPKPEAILAKVAADHGVTVEEVRGRRRYAHLMDPRREIAWRLWVETDLTLAEIGEVLGGRSHATIAYYLRRPR